MSIEALNWAFDQNIKSGRKFVLVVLANYADETGYCYPSRETIARKTGLEVRAVQAHLNWLDINGFIDRRRRQIGQKVLPNGYFVNWKSADVSERAKIALSNLERAKNSVSDSAKNDISDSAKFAPYTKGLKDEPKEFKSLDLNSKKKREPKKAADAATFKSKTPKSKKTEAAPSAPPSKEFLIFAKLCYGFPPDKIEFLSDKQKSKIETELERFSAAEIDLKDLIFFSDFWRDSWRSIDRKYQTFQRPRPEQIFELYFEFLESARLTETRLDFEKNYERLKLEKQQNGNGNKFDAINEYDYAEFAFISFN